MNMSLVTRITLACLSGIVVGFVFFDDVYGGPFDWLIYYGFPGIAFAAGVLFPYLKSGDRRLLRSVGLVLASSVSFHCAVWVALNVAQIPGSFMSVSTWISFTLASLTGATIIIVAVVLIAPIRASLALLLLGLFASLIGGQVAFATLMKNLPVSFVGYMAWHTLIAVAIYFGTPSTVAGARFSARLARVAPSSRI